MKDRGVDALINDSLVGTGESFSSPPPSSSSITPSPELLHRPIASSCLSWFPLLLNGMMLMISYHVGRLVSISSFSLVTLFPCPFDLPTHFSHPSHPIHLLHTIHYLASRLVTRPHFRFFGSQFVKSEPRVSTFSSLFRHSSVHFKYNESSC
jgi:hypothetical protein